MIILGSGPAGLTAALYTARANLEPVVLEGHQPGGQLTLTTTIENFPGFPEGVDAWDLMAAMKQQAIRFGATCLPESAIGIDLKSAPMKSLQNNRYQSQAVIIATGASPDCRPRKRPCSAEEFDRARATSLFRDKPIVVVGGGDSALEEALF